MQGIIHMVDSLSTRLRTALLIAAVCVIGAARAEAQCLPAPAAINGPVGNLTDPRPTFSWAAVPGATSYTLYVLTIPEETIALRVVGITGTSYTPPTPLPSNHDLRWKVKGEGPCGAGAYASGVGSFRIVAPAGCPALTERATPISPVGTIRSRNPTFCWTAVPGIEEYALAILYAADDSDYVLGHAIGVTGTCVTVPGLPVNTPMRWKVKTECDEHYGPFTDSVYFTIAP